MKRLLALLVLFPWNLLLAASDVPEPYPVGGIVRVIHRSGMGHGCPVGLELMLTAAHVPERNGSSASVAWSDLAGNEGRAEPLRQDQSRDLALLKVTSGKLVTTFALAKLPPKVGDYVYVVGYSAPTGNMLKVNAVQAKVLGTAAGHLWFSKSPGPGSSGACVLNAQREVVGVNVGGITESGHGIAVAVWGIWAPSLEE